MFKILITGGSGFLGSSLINKMLRSYKYKIINLDIRDNKIFSYKKNYKFIKYDISKKINVDSVPEKIDYVFHFAGLSDLDEGILNPIGTITQNILGVAKIIEFCLQKK